jgi:hypothetical protein
MRHLMTWLFCSFLWISSALASVNVTQIMGGAGDGFLPPPPPCTTFGFIEEATLTLPTGFNNGVLMRVMQSRYNNIGWVMTDDGVSLRIAVFDLTAMTLRASATLDTFPGKYRTAQRVQGDIDTDSRLYVFLEARNGGGSCAGGAGNNCIAFRQFTEGSLSTVVEAITGPDATVNLDDARQNGPQHFVLLNAEVTPTNGNRRFELFSKSSLLKLSNGTEFGNMGFGHLSRTFNGRLYGITNGNTANGLRLPGNSATSDGTFSLSASFGARLVGAIYGAITDDPANTNKILGSSDQTGGVQAFRAHVNESNLVNCCTNSYAVGGTNGAAIYQGTFYDSINNKVFSGRTDGANEEIIRTTPGPNTFTVEATLNCVACNYNIGSGTGSQIIDYAQHKMRLFTVSNQSPAVITRIGVCASGGPPA